MLVDSLMSMDNRQKLSNENIPHQPLSPFQNWPAAPKVTWKGKTSSNFPSTYPYAHIVRGYIHMSKFMAATEVPRLIKFLDHTSTCASLLVGLLCPPRSPYGSFIGRGSIVQSDMTTNQDQVAPPPNRPPSSSTDAHLRLRIRRYDGRRCVSWER